MIITDKALLNLNEISIAKLKEVNQVKNKENNIKINIIRLLLNYGQQRERKIISHIKRSKCRVCSKITIKDFT